MTRGRELLTGALLAAGSLFLALAVLEVAVRTMHLVPDRFWEPDPLLGARLVPDAQGWWTQEEREFVVPVRINSHGRRDVERPYEKREGTFRILVLGDSFVEALHVPLEESFPRLLEGLLAADLPATTGAGHVVQEVEVLSAGVSGYGTAAEALYFERDGRRYEPDAVLLAFYPGNDVKNNSPTLEDTFPPQYGADGALLKVGRARSPGRQGGLLSRWQTYRFVRKTVLTGTPGLARRLSEAGLLGADAVRTPQRRDGIPVDYGVYAVPLTEEWKDAWRRTEGLLDRLHGAVEAAGATFALTVLSSREQVEAGTWTEVLSTYPRMRDKKWDLDAPGRRVAEWCGRRHVRSVNVVDAFRAQKARSEEQLHFRHDGHLTPAGHRLLARVLKEFAERELFPKREQGARNEIL